MDFNQKSKCRDTQSHKLQLESNYPRPVSGFHAFIRGKGFEKKVENPRSKKWYTEWVNIKRKKGCKQQKTVNTSNWISTKNQNVGTHKVTNYNWNYCHKRTSNRESNYPRPVSGFHAFIRGKGFEKSWKSKIKKMIHWVSKYKKKERKAVNSKKQLTLQIGFQQKIKM